MPTKIQIRRGTASQWTSANPTLASGEFGLETDTGRVKLGTGTTAWTSLAYFQPINLDGLSDVTITSAANGQVVQYNGTTWVNSAITVSEISDLEATATQINYLGGAFPVTSSVQTQIDGKANTSHTQNFSTIITTVTDRASAYTILAADENTFIRSTSATAVTMTIANVLAIGESVQYIQFGAGQITFAAGAGVNLRSVDNKLKTNKQYSVAAITCVASGEYLVTGDLVA
jgi:hypothetical protein